MIQIAEHHPKEDLRRLVAYNLVVDAARVKKYYQEIS